MKKKVLIVDDETEIVDLILMILDDGHIQLFAAYDGVQALEIVREHRPDLVLSDVMMPRLDGWETASRLRDDADTAGIKVVLLSARAQEADLQRGDRIGVDAYLTKPFDPDELIATVRRLAGLPEA